jgi:hypothetical protein
MLFGKKYEILRYRSEWLGARLFSAAGGYLYLQTKHGNLPYFEYAKNEKGEMNMPFVTFFLIDALSVLV